MPDAFIDSGMLSDCDFSWIGRGPGRRRLVLVLGPRHGRARHDGEGEEDDSAPADA